MIDNEKKLPGPVASHLPSDAIDGPPSAAPAARSRSLTRRHKDQRLKRIVRRCRTLAPHLDNAAFGPVLQTFGRISILLSDAYEKLRGAELLNENGELRASIDTIRKLADTQAKLAEKLGLTPVTLRALGREKRVDLAAALADAETVDE